MERTDYQLIQECLGGNREIFSELMARYKKLVFSVVSNFTRDSEEVNDLSQEVFFKIYRCLSKYNPQFKFSTWTVKVATNLCLDHVRRKKLDSVSYDEMENMTGDFDTPEETFVRNEKVQAIREAIEQLPEMYKTPVLMYHQKDMSYKEMADQLGKPISIVKNRLYRARMILKENLAHSQAV